MAYRYFPDGDGAAIRLFDNDGRMLLVPVPQWNQVTRVTSREDDVLVCGYPRSGNHWTWEIVRMLKTGDCEVTLEDMKQYQLINCQPGGLDAMPSPRVLDTHRQFQELPSDFIINRRKLVLVVRDPRDVCVSCYNLMASMKKTTEYQGTFDGFLSLFLQGKVYMNSWSRWILSYEKGLKEHPEIPYHVVHYEQLIEDPVKEIGRLAEFLGVDPSVADTVAEKTNFSVMKDLKRRICMPELTRIFDDNKISTYFFRKGQTGEWEEWFTEERLTHFQQTLCEQLGRPSIKPLL